MVSAVFGRDAVLERAWEALRRPGRVLLEGPAGIGKTTVLDALIQRARNAGMQVLECAPAEAEQALALSGLADLLLPLAAEAVVLPGPQRRALEAVLLTGHHDAPVDERALAAAVRTLLADLASSAVAGVLLVVDDAPWLDPPSERALRFALRRLPADVAILVSTRTDRLTDDHVPLNMQVGTSEFARIQLEPLGAGPINHVLCQEFGDSLSRSMVVRLARESGGNPLLAIELTRAIRRLPRLPAPGEDLPVPSSMQELVASTLATLPAATVRALRLAALSSAPALPELAAAGVAPYDLDAGEEAGLVVVEADERVHFVHPVHAAAVRAGIPPGVQRRLRRRLAEVCTDPEERARHLAATTVRPDAGVAAELAVAAARARTRGAPEFAADLYDHAARLSPKHEVTHDQHLRTIECRYDSGDYAAAAVRADEVARTASGDQLAEIQLLRAVIAFSADDPQVAVASAQRALSTTGPDSELAGRIHAHLSVFLDLPGPSREHAEAALRLLPEADPDPDADPDRHDGHVVAGGDRGLLASVLMQLFLSEVRAGLPARTELLERALRLEGGEPTQLAGTVPAIWWKGNDEHDRARARLTWMLERTLGSGEEPLAHELMAHLGETETLAGDFVAAAHWIESARELGEQLSTGLAAELWLTGMLDVHRGNLEAATAAAAEGLARADRSGEPWARRINLLLGGFAALAAGRSAEAARAYAALADAMDQTGVVDSLGTRFEADWVEACVGTGDLAGAAGALRRLEQRHRRLPRPWTVLGLARGRVLLASAGGQDVEALIEALLEARAAVPVDVIPFERARCLTVVGIALRRARRKRAAREALLAAAAEFDALGAPSFAARARADAARTGARVGAPLELTSTEAQVAGLAAIGRTNRAIADALFISPKTVEANLARVYRKLSIRTRAELGAAVAARPSDPDHPGPQPARRREA